MEFIYYDKDEFEKKYGKYNCTDYTSFFLVKGNVKDFYDLRRIEEIFAFITEENMDCKILQVSSNIRSIEINEDAFYGVHFFVGTKSTKDAMKLKIAFCN